MPAAIDKGFRNNCQDGRFLLPNICRIGDVFRMLILSAEDLRTFEKHTASD